MEENNKGKIIATILIFLAVFGVATYYFIDVKYSDKDPKEEVNTPETKFDYNTYKIDNSKDFVYYEPLDSSDTVIQIYYQRVKFNFEAEETADILSTLNNKIDVATKTITYLSADELANSDMTCEDGIKSIEKLDFQNFNYQNYVSLLTLDVILTCPLSNEPATPSSYVFDLDAKKLLSATDLLIKFELTTTDLNNKIRTHLNEITEEMVATDETMFDFINATETISNLANNKTYALYVDNLGRLVVNYIIQTKEYNYNETLILT